MAAMKTRETVLMLEDNPVIGNLLALTLEHRGCRVLRASNGQQAIELARAYRSEISLALCEIVLQGEPGAPVAAAIREICPKVKILFISGLPIHVLCERSLLTPEDLKEGPAFYLKQPLLPKDLMGVVERILAAGLAARAVSAPRRSIQNAMSGY